jgi:hypothetical protein
VPEEPTDIDSGLVDLTGVDISGIPSETVLGPIFERIYQESLSSVEAVAGFSSSI